MVGELYDNWPTTARLILSSFLGNGTHKPSTLCFGVDVLPPTSNHMYLRNSSGRSRLSDEAVTFRQLVNYAIGHQKHVFTCRGTACLLYLMESPFWVTKEHVVRDMDVDNRTKAMADAIMHSIQVTDSTNWEIHQYKVASKKTRTTVYLFDMGDLVQFHT